MLPLFEIPEPELKAKLAPRLKALAAEQILFGTSSWKYEGWLGQIYTPERYRTRGKHSTKRFEETCLAEYSEVFPIVCGDFSFYQFPSPEYWAKLFAGAPRSLEFAFKVPEEVTVKQWPGHARYGSRAGLENEAYLDAGLFERAFLEVLKPYADRIRVLIFEFSPMSRAAMPTLDHFLARLDPFLAALPRDFRYAVEIRNPEFFAPDYLAVLTDHGVAHVFNSWTRMPELGQQWRYPGAFTTDFTVTRALLRQGRAYEDAVKLFSPYERVQDVYPAGRTALREIVAEAKLRKQPAFLFVNNRLEGNAPQTIEAVLEE